MRIAVLADIHGNHIALRRVLDAAKDAGADQLFVLGDIVGYYYHPAEVMDLLEEWDLEMIQGNHERLLAAAENSDAAAACRAKYGSGIQCAIQELSNDRRAFLKSLPATRRADRDEIRFLLCHGSPSDPDEYVYPDAATKTLRRCLVSDFDIVLSGHTHHPFVYFSDGKVLLNPGSVGQPRNVGNLAGWALIDTSNGVVIPKRTRFDPSPIVAEARRRDPHLPQLADVLLRDTP